MLRKPTTQAEVVSFGPFTLSPSERLLTKDGEPVKVGGRAFDILSILVENAGAVVSQKELLERAWPGIFVEDVSLRVRVADLRKILESDEQRYLVNVPGRGYSFVGQVSHATVTVSTEASQPIYSLPLPPAQVVGRSEIVLEVGRSLLAQRFISIVGPGGIGKTTVAFSVAWALLNDFKGEVCVVELGRLEDPALVASAVVSSFGLAVQGDDPVARLVSELSGKRVLLVLDGAEHLIANAALLAERLFGALEGLHILATSREALRVEGERVFQLRGLESPPPAPNLTLAEVGAYPAANLFLERCRLGEPRSFIEKDAPIIADICRRLSGMPLALELAAGSVSTYGLEETAELLDSEFALRWPGRRTAPARHQTLNATLEWSYNLLSETERTVLRRLSVFARIFTLASARRLATHGNTRPHDVLEALNGLVAKSMVSVDASATVPKFRLLDTTRTYAASKLAETAEVDELRRKQASHYRDTLRETGGDLQAAGDDLIELDDIRAALRWSFGKGGDDELGADLATFSAPVWLGKALLNEGRAWLDKAATVYGSRDDTAPQQLQLQLARASAEAFEHGLTSETIAAWAKTLEMAESLGNAMGQHFAYIAIWGREIRETWYADAMATAERCAVASARSNDNYFRITSEWMLGHTKHHLGRLGEARAHLSRALELDSEDARFDLLRGIGYDRKTDMLGIMGNTLWMLGLPDQARQWGDWSIDAARELQFEMPLGVAMIWAGLNRYFADGDIEQDMVDLLEHGRSHGLTSEVAFALSFLGLCQAKHGEFGEASRLVTEGLRLFADAHMETFSPIALAHLCEAAINLDRVADAERLMADLGARDRNPEHFYTPEILRVRALLAIAQGAEPSGEELFGASIAMARRQGALSWELKTATSAANFMASRDRGAEALETLAPIYGRFTEGFETADLRSARDTLARVGAGR